jgi:hypothetical protein
MEARVCQCCASVIKGHASFCTTCGTPVSDATATPLIAAGLTQGERIQRDPSVDPLALERAIGQRLAQSESHLQPNSLPAPQPQAPPPDRFAPEQEPVTTYDFFADNAVSLKYTPTAPNTVPESPPPDEQPQAQYIPAIPSARFSEPLPAPAPAPPLEPAPTAKIVQAEPEPIPHADQPAPLRKKKQPAPPAESQRSEREPARKSLPPLFNKKFAVLVVLFGIVAFAWHIFSNQPREGAAPTSMFVGNKIAGQWQVLFESDNGTTEGMLSIKLLPNHAISGRGIDSANEYTIKGSYNYPNISFDKRYNNNLYVEPTRYYGMVNSAGNLMRGDWHFIPKHGATFINRSIRTHTYQWEARLVRREMDGGSTQKMGIVDMLKIAAFSGVALALLAVLFSTKLFSSDGLLNIWRKKEYIPSQYKSQHMKLVQEYGGKPARGGTPLGKRVDWNIFQMFAPTELSLPPHQRETNPHMVVLGTGAKGKTRLIANMIAHDIESNDRAVVVIDTDGRLVDLMMRWLGSHSRRDELAERVTVIDPTRSASNRKTPSYNPLEFPKNGDIQSAASSVVNGFKAIYSEPVNSQTQWSPQTANILRNAVLLLMANGRSLSDLVTLLSENDFRDVLLERVEKHVSSRPEFITLIEAWAQYKRLARTDQWISWVEPILNRVQPVLGDPRVRPLLTGQENTIDLQDIVNKGKILFVKIPHGRLDRNGCLFGSLLISGLRQAAMACSSSGAPRKRPCAVYLDEMDNMIAKETFEQLTTETRDLQIGLVACSKTLQSLPEDFRHTVPILAGTMACFAMARKDAEMLGPQMFRVDGRKIKHATLANVLNPINTSPQFELISDEEKLNVDRVVGQEERTYFCYRVGTTAGVFQLKTHNFADPPENKIDWSLLDELYTNHG